MSALKLHRDGPRDWRLADTASGDDVGGISYVHASDGNHYRPWVLIDHAAREFGDPLPQLAMAARAIADEVARIRGEKT